MSAASFDENYLAFLQDPRTQRSIKARGEDPGKILMEETLRQQGIGPSSIFGGLGGSTPGIVPEPDRRYGDRFGRTPGIVPEFEYKLTDVNRGQQMQESVKQFYDSLDSPGIRDRVDAFVRGLGEAGEDLARIPLAGSPRTIQYSPPGAILKSPHIDSPHMDQLFQRGFRPLSAPQAPPAGPQLPGFV